MTTPSRHSLRSRCPHATSALWTAAVLAAAASAVAQRQFDPLEGQNPPGSDALTSSVAIGDLDGDGDLDLIHAKDWWRFCGACPPPGRAQQDRLYLNDGNGNFVDATNARMPADTTGTTAIALGDVDGDGDLDMAVAKNRYGNDRNRLYLNDGAARFTDVTATQMPPSLGAFADLAFGDVDGDGDLDLVCAGGDPDWSYGAGLAGQNRLFLNDGAGTFTDATSTRIPPAARITADVELGDVDGDGDLDLVAAVSDVYGVTSQNRLYLNDGSGTFTEAPAGSLPAVSAWTRAITLGDIDGDGDLDMACGNGSLFFGRVPDRLYLNQGAGTFVDVSGSRRRAYSENTVDIAFVDVDLDGDLDLVSATLGLTDRLYLNDGRGVFQDVTSSRMPRRSSAPRLNSAFPSAVFGDVDGDGDPDLLSTPGLVTLNLLRHMDTPRPAIAGGNYQIDLYARYGATNALAIGVLSPARAAIPSPFGVLGVDLTNAVTLPFTPIPQPAGWAWVTFAIPNSPAFVGTSVFGQALVVDLTTMTGRLTNVTSDVIQ